MCFGVGFFGLGGGGGKRANGNSQSANLRTGATMTDRRPSLALPNLKSISVPPKSAIDTGTYNRNIRLLIFNNREKHYY